MTQRPWSAEDVDALRAMLSAGVAANEAARRLRRNPADVAERTRLLTKSADAAEPSNGPDEEGDVTPPPAGDDEDPAAWVHAGRT